MSASHKSAARRNDEPGLVGRHLTILPGVGLVDLDGVEKGELVERLAGKVGDPTQLAGDESAQATFPGCYCGHPGRLAQWESASFTPRRPLVQSQHRPRPHLRLVVAPLTGALPGACPRSATPAPCHLKSRAPAGNPGGGESRRSPWRPEEWGSPAGPGGRRSAGFWLSQLWRTSWDRRATARADFVALRQLGPAKSFHRSVVDGVDHEHGAR